MLGRLRASNPVIVSNRSTASSDYRPSSPVKKWLGLGSMLLVPLIDSCGGASPVEEKGDGGSHGDGGTKSALCSEAQGNPLRYMEVFRGGELQEDNSSVELVDAARYGTSGPWLNVRAIGSDRVSIDTTPDGHMLLVENADQVDFNMPNGKLSVAGCNVVDDAGKYGDQFAAFLAFSRDMAVLFCSPNDSLYTSLQRPESMATTASTNVELGDGFRLSIRLIGFDSSSTATYNLSVVKTIDGNDIGFWEDEKTLAIHTSVFLSISFNDENGNPKSHTVKLSHHSQRTVPGVGAERVEMSAHRCDDQ